MSSVSGTPEYVAYYTVYRDTVSGFTPSPANKVADVTLDVDTAMPGLQWYDETAVVQPGLSPVYYYIVRVHDEAGYELENSNYAVVSDVGDGPPTPGLVRNVTVHPNAPNPFSRGTEVRYDLAVAGWVTVSIFSLGGQKIATLVDGEQAAGPQAVDWDARNSQGAAVNSGIYFCRIERAGVIATTKMILLR
jgi:hypothetical protein